MHLTKQLALTLFLVMMSLNIAQAAAPAGRSVTAEITLQGGSSSNAKWRSPLTLAYKIHVLTPKTGGLSNVLYRIYPKGKNPNSAICDSANVSYPCIEITVNQTLSPNSWVQLMINGDPQTYWNFVKSKGYVTVVASNLGAGQLLTLPDSVRFEPALIKVGKTYQGGIIFYVDRSGVHGLIAAPTDQNNIGIQWNNGSSYIPTGATATATGKGETNTNAIVTAQGPGNYAAKLCADLVIGAYTDWFLPSKDELNLMYKNIGPGAPSPLTNIGNFAGYSYWSSSEFDDYYAWYQNFSGGYQYNFYKTGSYYVRAVRAF